MVDCVYVLAMAHFVRLLSLSASLSIFLSLFHACVGIWLLPCCHTMYHTIHFVAPPRLPHRESVSIEHIRNCSPRNCHSKNISNSNGYFRFVIELFSYSDGCSSHNCIVYVRFIYIYEQSAFQSLQFHCNFVFNLKIMLFFCVSTAHVW